MQDKWVCRLSCCRSIVLCTCWYILYLYWYIYFMLICICIYLLYVLNVNFVSIFFIGTTHTHTYTHRHVEDCMQINSALTLLFFTFKLAWTIIVREKLFSGFIYISELWRSRVQQNHISFKFFHVSICNFIRSRNTAVEIRQ